MSRGPVGTEPPPPVRAMLDRIREDASVTRRDYLRILVTISGGLLAGTVAVAIGVFGRRDEATGTQTLVAREIAPGGSARFAYPGADDPAVAIRLADGALVAYSSVCTHLSCMVLWNPDQGRIDCPCHDGAFAPLDGHVLAGPPPRALPRIELAERRDGIYAVGVISEGVDGAS